MLIIILRVITVMRTERLGASNQPATRSSVQYFVQTNSKANIKDTSPNKGPVMFKSCYGP